MTHPSGEHLEDLLDEALEDFQDNAAVLAASPPRANAGVSSIAHPPTAQASADGSSQPEPSATGADSSKSGQKGKGKQGLAFNPLPKRSTARGSAAGSHGGMANGTGAAGPHQREPFVGGPPIGNQRGIGAIPPDVMNALGQEGLEEGLQQLMAELAQVDLANQQSAGGAAADAAATSSGSSSAGRGPQGLSGSTRGSSGGSKQPERGRGRDVGATLQALAEQTRSLQPDSGTPAGPSGRPQGPMDDEFLRQLGAAGLPNLGGPGEGGGPSMEATFADSIMRQLLSKEVLHQPMQDIGARYPQWLAENRSKLSNEDIQRYEKQQEYIRKVCHVYDTRPNSFAELLDLMHEMQACGQPPPEIVDELAPGLALGEDGPFGPGPGGENTGSTPPGCPVQ